MECHRLGKGADVRIAQQIVYLLMLPFGGISVAGEPRLVQLGNGTNLLTIAGVLMVVDILFLYVAKATFRRQEILTKWK
jgi:hypothetical protein